MSMCGTKTHLNNSKESHLPSTTPSSIKPNSGKLLSGKMFEGYRNAAQHFLPVSDNTYNSWITDGKQVLTIVLSIHDCIHSDFLVRAHDSGFWKSSSFGHTLQDQRGLIQLSKGGYAWRAGPCGYNSSRLLRIQRTTILPPKSQLDRKVICAPPFIEPNADRI